MSVDALDKIIQEIKKLSFPFVQYLCGVHFLVFVTRADMSVKLKIVLKKISCSLNPEIPPHKLLMFTSLFMSYADWKTKLGCICCDGTPTMLGKKSEFGALVKAESPQVKKTHCYFHHHLLAWVNLP